MVGIVNKVYCENMIGCMCHYFPKQGNSLVYSRVTKATYWPICCYTTLLVTKKLLKCQKAYLIVTRVISKDC